MNSFSINTVELVFPVYDECSSPILHSYFTHSLSNYIFKRMIYFQRVCDFGRSLTASISDFQVHNSLNCLVQCFPNLSWRTPRPVHFVSLPNQTPNLVLAVSTNELVSGIRCVIWGDIQKEQSRGSSRTGLGSTGLVQLKIIKETKLIWFSELECLYS